MTPLLALLPLLLPAPAQTSAQAGPQAADFLPADTLVAFEVSIEPWQRLGDRTILAQIFQQEGLAEMVGPMRDQVQTQLAQVSAQVGLDLASLLSGARMHFAVSQSLIRDDSAQLVFGFDLPADIAEGMSLAERLNTFGQGAWWQEGQVLVGTIHTTELETIDERIGPGFENGAFVPSPRRQEDLAYLQQLVQAGREGAGLTGRASFRSLAAKGRTGNELFGLWFLTDQLDRDWLEQAAGEEPPAELERVLTTLGLDAVDGVAYSFSVQPPMLEDRLVVAGENFGSALFPAEMLAQVNLPALLDILPHDTMRAQLGAMDYSEVARLVRELIGVVAELEGETIPPEGEEALALLDQALNAIGPVSAAVTRVADVDRGMSGDFWLQVRDAEALQGVMDALPPEVQQAMDTGLMLGPGMPNFQARIDGQRLVILESAGQPSTQLLATQAEFQSAADWLDQFPAGQVWGVDFVHRDQIVAGFDVIRSRGDDVLGLAGGNLPFRFESLPEPVVMRALMRPMVSAYLVDETGIWTRSRSPFGMVPTGVLVALPTMVEMFESFGMALEPAFDEEEF